MARSKFADLVEVADEGADVVMFILGILLLVGLPVLTGFLSYKFMPLLDSEAIKEDGWAFLGVILLVGLLLLITIGGIGLLIVSFIALLEDIFPGLPQRLGVVISYGFLTILSLIGCVLWDWLLIQELGPHHPLAGTLTIDAALLLCTLILGLGFPGICIHLCWDELS